MGFIVKKFALRAALCSLALSSSAVLAGTIGTATAADVTLDGISADLLSYGNGINPQSQGPRGGSFVFGPAFSATGTGAWTRLAAFGGTADNGFALSSTALGTSLTMSFDQTNGRHGGWTISNNDSANDVEVDLVFAIHTGGGSGAFLFDEQVINAGKTLTGSWALNLLNNGKQYAGYSNLTVFGRNLTATPITLKDPVKDEPLAPDAMPGKDVPEPATLGTMLLGLAVMGLMSRKRA